jgi:predicted ATPase
MHYSSFRIKNFRGILDLTIEVDPLARISTLVGLNESGKTTILEALSLLYEHQRWEQKGVKEPLLHTIQIEDLHSLIPKSRKANFNDAVELRAEAVLDAGEQAALAAELALADWKTREIGPKAVLTVSYIFKNSTYSKSDLTWELPILGNMKGKGKSKPKQLADVSTELWGRVKDWLSANIPPIIYYPNFLFDFPDQIYVEARPKEEADSRDLFYRAFLQDVLDDLDGGFSLTTHVLDRAKRTESSEHEALELVIYRMADRISELVFDPGTSVFAVDATAKRSVIITNPQADSQGFHFVSIKLKDGVDTYFIRERSLGFRWFFTFLLMTRFRAARARGRAPLFLFDEPASNLHQTAQQKLLNALNHLVTADEDDTISVIYTTHSHHLIDPKRLGSTFIVRNAGLTATGIDERFSSDRTEITMTPYRDFVGQYPDKHDYFQPILDVLEYRPSNLEDLPNVVMAEGKNDYYVIAYVQQALEMPDSDRISVLPSGGAGALDTPIKLYLGWNREFVVLLDADPEGIKQKARYAKIFGRIVEGRLKTLADVDPAWSGLALEGLFTEADRETIQRQSFPNSTVYKKKEFHLALQEQLVLNNVVDLSANTRQNFEQLLEFLRKQLLEAS